MRFVKHIDAAALRYVGADRVALAGETAEAAAELTQEDFVRQYGDQLCEMHLRKQSRDYEPDPYIVRHRDSGLYIKIHPNKRDALLQQAVMNTLAETLQNGLSAVCHPCVVAGRKAVSLIEPATDRKSLRALTRNVDSRRREIHKLRQELDRQLGRVCARILVNDLARGDKVGGNISIGEDGTRMLIDQPLITWFNEVGVVSALALLQQKSVERLDVAPTRMLQ